MDQIIDLVDAIQRICDGKLNEEQLTLITQLLKNSEWFPDKKDYFYMYRLYKEMKIATEAEIRMYEEKYNCDVGNKEKIDAHIEKLTRLLDSYDKIINNYTNALRVIMNSYGEDKAKVFYYFYFKGYTPKEISREVPWLAIGTISNWKSQFQKDLEKIHIDLY